MTQKWKHEEASFSWNGHFYFEMGKFTENGQKSNQNLPWKEICNQWISLNIQVCSSKSWQIIFCHLKLWHVSKIPWQNVMNRDLFRIGSSSYISPCYFSLVLTAFYGKIMAPANVAKFWLRTSNNAYGRITTLLKMEFEGGSRTEISF